MTYNTGLGSNAETFGKSMEFEMFLKTILNLHESQKAEMDLKGGYQIMVEYEQGKQSFFSESEYKSHIKRVLRYFGKAIDKVAKSNPEAKKLKSELEFISSSKQLWNLFEELKIFKEEV